MAQVQIEASQLREVVKQAVVEALVQHKELVYEAVSEALEDIAMAKAIHEGDRSDFVSREGVFEILESEE
ncbi:MAG TPA: hypothetical protein VGG06_10165 [Thermoanaerobaculia bacterium]|jgi:hypothetical protein